MEPKEIQLLVLFSIVTFLLITIGFAILFYVFQKRKTQLLIEKAQEKQRYESELIKSQTEIQEQAFKNISWELHDNIGQLLSVAKMQLNLLSDQIEEKNKKRLVELSDVVGKSLQDLRLLSRTLNHEVIQKIGLKQSLELELQRFNRLKFLKATLQVNGEEKSIDDKDEIIIFRIFQEFFSNVVKHSKAKNLKVFLNYNDSYLELMANDDGVGFDTEKKAKGIGLMNMKSRAELIKSDYKLVSRPGEGTCIRLKYNLKRKKDDAA